MDRGAFAASDDGSPRSYTSGYPEPGDLYLSRMAEVDPDSEFIEA